MATNIVSIYYFSAALNIIFFIITGQASASTNILSFVAKLINRQLTCIINKNNNNHNILFNI